MAVAVIDPGPAAGGQRDAALCDRESRRLRRHCRVVVGCGNLSINIVVARRRRLGRDGGALVAGIIVIRHFSAAGVRADRGRAGRVAVGPAVKRDCCRPAGFGNGECQRNCPAVIARQRHRHLACADVDVVAVCKRIVRALGQRRFAVLDCDGGFDGLTRIGPVGFAKHRRDAAAFALLQHGQRAIFRGNIIVRGSEASHCNGIGSRFVPGLVSTGNRAGKDAFALAGDKPNRRIGVFRRGGAVGDRLVVGCERERFFRDGDRRGIAGRGLVLAVERDRDDDRVFAAVGHVLHSQCRGCRAGDNRSVLVPLVGHSAGDAAERNRELMVLSVVFAAVIRRLRCDGEIVPRPFRVKRHSSFAVRGNRRNSIAAEALVCKPAVEAVTRTGGNCQRERFGSKEEILARSDNRPAFVVSVVIDLGCLNGFIRFCRVSGSVLHIKGIDAGRRDLLAHGHGCGCSAFRRLPLVCFHVCRCCRGGKGVFRNAAAGVGGLTGQLAVIAAGPRRVAVDRRGRGVRGVCRDRNGRVARIIGGERRRRRGRGCVRKGNRSLRGNRPAGEGPAAAHRRAQINALQAGNAADQQLRIGRRDGGDARAGLHRDLRGGLTAADGLGGFGIVRGIGDRRFYGEGVDAAVIRFDDVREIVTGIRSGNGIAHLRTVLAERERIARNRAGSEGAAGRVLGDRRPRGNPASPLELRRRGSLCRADGQNEAAVIGVLRISVTVGKTVSQIIAARLCRRSFCPLIPCVFAAGGLAGIVRLPVNGQVRSRNFHSVGVLELCFEGVAVRHAGVLGRRRVLAIDPDDIVAAAIRGRCLCRHHAEQHHRRQGKRKKSRQARMHESLLIHHFCLHICGEHPANSQRIAATGSDAVCYLSIERDT